MRRCLVLYGLTCLVAQVLALRELAVVFQGNELVYGAALAVWLALTAVGSGLLGRLAVRHTLGVPAFALTLAGGGVLAPVTILLARLTRFLVIGGAAPSLGAVLLAALITFAPLCLLLGFFYALACAVAGRGPEPAPATSARVYGFAALGAFVGGLLLTCLLLNAMSAFEIGLALAALDCLTAFVLWWHTPRAGRYGGWALALLAAAFVAFAISPMNEVADFLSQRFPDRVLRLAVDTPCGRVQVAEAGGQVEFYQNGSRVGVARLDRAAEEAAFLPLLAHPQPRRVLLIGGAAAGVLRKTLELPWLRVDYTDVDPALIATAQEFADPKDREALASPRVTLITDVDARRFIQTTPIRYDIILSAAPEPATAWFNRFYTQEFFLEARRALAANGVFAFALDGAPARLNAAQRAEAASLYATARRSFGSVLVLPSDTGIRFFATPPATAFDTPVWAARMRFWQMHPAWLNETALRDLTNPTRLAALQSALASVRAPALHTDLRPLVYDRWQQRWAEALRVNGVPLLDWARELDLWTALLAVAVVTAVTAAGATFARRPLRVGLPAARMFAGFAGMALELVLILAFQGLYGCAYGQLGLLLGAFMVGVAMGAHLSARSAAQRTDLRMMLVLQTALGVLAAALAPVLGVLSSPAARVMPPWIALVIPLLSLCVGVLVGGQYPLAVAACSAPSRGVEPARTVAAGLYAFELLGAGIGALLATAVLVPALGLVATCWLVCALSMAALPLILLSERKRA